MSQQAHHESMTSSPPAQAGPRGHHSHANSKWKARSPPLLCRRQHLLHASCSLLASAGTFANKASPGGICPVSLGGKTTAEQQEAVCLLNSQDSASPSVKWAWRETQAVATTQGTVLGSLSARRGFVWSKCDLYPT